MMLLLELLSLTLVVLTMVPSLAHALEMPGKLRLPREHYLPVQTIYYPGFTLIGAAEPLALIALIALLLLTEAGTLPFWLMLAAAVAAAATHLLYWTLTAPVNRVWVQDAPLAGGARRFFDAAGRIEAADWTVLRDRWEWSHVCRAVTSTVAFLMLAVALLLPSR